MRILAVDFGEKRIGLAVSDLLGFTAQALETLPNTGRVKTLIALAQVCREREVKEIVVGLPINMDGTMGPKAKEILELAPVWEKELGVPVKTWDERLSTRQINRLMAEGGASRADKKAKTDQLAAVLILQNYLESKRDKSS